MIEKGFLKNQQKSGLQHSRISSMVSKTLLYLGALVLIGSFVYLAMNLDQSATVLSMMLPFLIAGMGMIFVSQLIQRASTKLRR
jgi:hypothetical protein